MVVVCADHGELHGEHDLYGHEFCLYDPLVNVPLLVKHPALDGGRRTDQVELLDLYHTVLDALDVDGGVPADEGETAVACDRTRSLLSESYRRFRRAATPDPAQRAAPDGDYAFVEYSRPVVELKQLEEKASDAGITLPTDSRFYSRMRAARRPDAKYVRIDRIPDEAYRLDRDPGEEEMASTDDEVVAATEAALSAFETHAGGAWTDALDDEVSDDTVSEMDDEAQDRLRDLGYLE
jgi:arylsulfatase A-like enzyme